MKKRPMFFVLLLSFLFISCENLLSPKDSYNNGDGKTYTITGDINIEGALPNELFNENSTNSVARTGIPTVPNILDSDLNLSVSAKNADSSSTIEGTINPEKTQYSINLPKGQWTITVSGEKSDVVILEGSVTVVLNDEYPVINSEIIILKPVKTRKGNLSLKLALSIGSFNCGGVKATLSSSEESKTDYFLFTDSEGKPASKIDLVFNDIPSGTYSFKLEFYESMSINETDDYVCENIIYILNDTVNIFDGLTTNEWSGTGYSEDKTTFTLTQEMIANFAMTTFYVADDGNDDNKGTFFAPIKSINKVLEKIDTINDGTSEYRIYIKGDINSDSDSFENYSFINITPTNTLNLLIYGFGSEKSTINANRTNSNTGRVMYIGENANVTLQNLILTGGYLADNSEQCDGAGLYIENNATVKIENCEISGNHAKDGGGLYLCPIANDNDNGGNLLELSNCTIRENTATSSGGGILFCPTHGYSDDKITTLNLTNCTISSNKATQMGGGIYSHGKKPNVIMKDGSISGNTCISTGSSSYGGGVYVSDGTFSMEGCRISGNTAGSETSYANAYGGGIYGASGTKIDMNDTTIFGNKVASVNDVNGAGVSLSGAELTMQENSKISGNSCVFGELASSYGGGVYINNSSKFTMTSGEISENSAKYGGGVSVSGGTFEMNGGSISNNTADNNGKGVYVVKSNDTEPTFEISGDAYIEDNNDVYLTKKQIITITGNLSSEIVATITPQNYAEDYAENSAEDVDVQVLDAGKDITLSEQVGKFNVTKYNNNNNVETTITDTGFLKNTLTLGENAELTEDLYDICSTIKVSSADGMNAISDLSQKKEEVAGKDFAGKTIILENDVELNSNYVPIKTFSGVFDGNNKTISGLTTEGKNYNYYVPDGKALFNEVKGAGAEIKNLTVKGTAFCAGIAWTLTEDAKISYCTNMVDVTNSNDSPVGGIVSELNNGGIIENCINDGIIIGTRNVGGLVGEMSKVIVENGNHSEKTSIIANCANKKNVSVKGTRYYPDTSIGGICGSFNYGTIYNSYNIGDVTIDINSSCGYDAEKTSEHLGGIVGVCWGTNIEGIINCYNRGEISSNSSSSTYTIEKRIGGILGATATTQSIIKKPRFVNTVNNYAQIVSFGTLEQYDTENTKNNYYKNDGNYYLYESSNANDIGSVINTLNDYSTESNGKYLEWKEDDEGNIVFSKEISDNQGITP